MSDEEDNAYAIGSLMVQIEENSSRCRDDPFISTCENAVDAEYSSPQTDSSEPLHLDSRMEPSASTTSEAFLNAKGMSMDSRLAQSTNNLGVSEISSTVPSSEDPCNKVDIFDPKIGLDYQTRPPYVNYIPYSAIYQGSSALPYPYSSTPFHGIPYGYHHHSMETTTQTSHPVFIKDLFHSSFLPNIPQHYINTSAQHLNRTNFSHYYMKPSISSSADNLERIPYKESNNLHGMENEVRRQDSGFIEDFTEDNLNENYDELCIDSDQKVSDFQSKSMDDFEEFEEKVSSEPLIKNLETEGSVCSDSMTVSESLIHNSLQNGKVFGSIENYSLIKERSISESSCSSSEEMYSKEIGSEDVDTGNNSECDANIISVEENENKQECRRPDRYRKCKGSVQHSSSSESFNLRRLKGKNKSNNKIGRYLELLSCNECDYSSYNKSNFKNHLFIHSEERLFPCQYCTYRGKQSAGLRAHLKVHSIEKPFKCSVCNYKCKRKQNLIQHFRIHSRQRPFFCRYCEYKSTTKQSLQKHMIRHFSDTSVKFKKENKATIPLTYEEVNDHSCDQLENNNLDTFGQQKENKREKSDQTEAVTLNCPHCEFSSVRKCALRNHIKSHKNKPTKGTLFDYKCKSEEDLSLHTSSHNIINNLKCIYCTFETSSAPVFIRHLNMHKLDKVTSSENHSSKDDLGNKKSGTSESHLNNKKEDLLHCPYCSFKSASLAYLKLHICNHCDEDFWSFVKHPSNMNRKKERLINPSVSESKVESDKNECQRGKERTPNNEQILEDKNLSLENLHKIINYERVNGKGKFNEEMGKNKKNEKVAVKKKVQNSFEPFRNCKWNFNFFKSRTYHNLKLKKHLEARSQALRKRLGGKVSEEKANNCTIKTEFAKEKEKEDSNSKYEFTDNDDKDIEKTSSVSSHNNRVIPLNENTNHDYEQLKSQCDFISDKSRNLEEENSCNKNGLLKNEISSAEKETCNSLDDENLSSNINVSNSSQPPAVDNSLFYPQTTSSIKSISNFSSDSSSGFTSSDQNKKASSDSSKTKCINEEKSRTPSECAVDASRYSYLYNYEQFLKMPEGKNSSYMFKNALKDKCSYSEETYALGYDDESTKKDMNVENEDDKKEGRTEENYDDGIVAGNKTEFPSTSKELYASASTEKPFKILDTPKKDETYTFHCDKCDSKFRRKSSLVNHKRSHEKYLFKCKKCSITFKFKKSLEVHEKTHQKGKYFQCSVCGFKSLRKCSLMSHYRIHKGKFKCMYCSFQCSLIKEMENHYVQHNEEFQNKG